MDVEVVLTQTDTKLGERGQVIKVSSGHAYNFLIPNQKAKLATPANLKSFKEEKERQSRKEGDRRAHAETLAKKINETSLTVEVLVGEGDKLYGAITAQDIHERLLSQGISLEKKDIHLEAPIRQLGAYQVPVKLHPQVSVNLRLSIVKKKP